MKLKAKVISAAVVSALGMINAAHAVNLSEDGRGQVLLYPYFTAQGDNDSAFSVVNTTSVGKAVKVRFLEAKNSNEVLDFNLYLSPRDTWSGVVTRDASGNPILRTWDASCTAPIIPASTTVAGAKEVGFFNFQVVGDADKGGVDANRMKEGYIEVIQMGDFNPLANGANDDLDPATAGVQNLDFEAKHVAGVPRNCALIESAWNAGGAFKTDATAGLVVPTGGLVGSAVIINVPAGTDYSFDPVVLDNFSDSILHNEPGSTLPSLGDVSPASSTVLALVPISDNWLEPIDAVSAVLMHQTVLNEYVTGGIASAGTDWVVTFPTKKAYVQKESSGFATRAPFTAVWDDTVPAGTGASAVKLAEGLSQGSCEAVFPVLYGTEEQVQSSGVVFSPKPAGASFALCWEANVVTFGTSNVLNSTNVKYTVTSPYNAGWMKLAFTSVDAFVPGDFVAVTANNAGHLLIAPPAPGSHQYLGLPAVGFAVNKFVNGNVSGVLSNYGGAAIHKYNRAINSID